MIVVDASVAAKWILAEPHSDRAEALYNATLQAGEPIVAPGLLLFEITNILRRRMVRFLVGR
jgi:predicted nucleic acid-binding protein